MYRSILLTAMAFIPMSLHAADLIEPVQPFAAEVAASIDKLPQERKTLLDSVADYVATRVGDGKPAKLTFICTHNSRRSHLAQIWCQVAAEFYGVPKVMTYSGGTESTACNIRTVRALRRAGLSVVASTSGENPRYLVQYSEDRPPLNSFSKVYDRQGNPTEAFAAMMCCSDADQRCPVVAGSDGRFPLHYEDPKVADGTPQEAQKYDERCRQIAEEMFYVMSQVAKTLRGQG